MKFINYKRLFVILIPLVAIAFFVIDNYYGVIKENELEIIKNGALNDLNAKETLFNDTYHKLATDINVIQWEFSKDFVQYNTPKRDKLSEFFLHLSSLQTSFDQIRFIDTLGYELLRVDYDSIHSSYLLPSNQLQDKSDRYYFKSIKQLKKDEIYYSGIDLNKEFGQIEYPYNPVLRVAQKTFNTKGEWNGALIINYYINDFIQKIALQGNPVFTSFELFDDGGECIISDDKSKTFSSQKTGSDSALLRYTHEDLWEKSRHQANGQCNCKDAIFLYKKIQLDKIGVDHIYFENSGELLLVNKINLDDVQLSQLHYSVYEVITIILAFLFILITIIGVQYYNNRLRIQNQGLEDSNDQLNELKKTLETTLEIKLDELKLTEKKYYSLFTNVGIGMTLVSLEGKPVFANKKLTEILGYSEEELSQMNVIDFTYPEDIDLKEFKRLINREIDSFDIEKRYIRKDGAIIWGDLNASLLVDNDDNIINVIAAVSDITDKKENEIKLFEHSQIIDQVVEAIISIDEEARINYWNKGAQSLFGYFSNEIIGESVTRLYAHEHTEEFLKNILEVLKRENSTSYEQQMIKKEGDVFYAKITVSNKYNNSGVNVGRLVSITDISKEKDSELKLLSLNHELKDHVLFLNNIMDFSPSAMWIANPEGTVIRTNQSLRNILQLKDEQILDKYNVLKDQNLIDQGVMPLVEKVFSEHSVARFEIKWVESETGIDSFNKGKKYFLDLTIFPIVNEKGVLQNVVCQWVDVTDRKSAEEEIISQRNKLSKILTVAPVGIGQTINRIFTEVNLVFCEILGYSREELIGKSSRYIYPSQEEFENVGEKKSAQIEKYGTGRLETSFKTKDGRILNIILASTPVDKLDLSKGSIFTVLDITEQKKAEKEVEKYQHHLEKLVKQRTEALESSNVRLKENQYRLDAAFTTSGYAWWDYRVKEGRLITHSAIFEALGYVQDEVDTPIFWWSRQLHPDDKKIIRDIIQRIDEGADTFDCEIRLKHRNGNYQWFKERGSVITRDKASCPLRFIGTSEDITDKKKTEFDLLKLSQAVEQSPVVVVITNNKAEIEYVNPAFETLAGYTPEEIIGKNPRILNARVLPSSVYKNLWKTILSGKTWSGELCNRTKRGEIFWENAIITPVIDAYGEIVNFIAVKENITERKKFIEELEKAKHEAEAGNRAKSEFLANMSHEIRTPMNAVIGFTDILSHKLTNPLHLKHLDSIKTSSKNLLTIINDILDVSKIEAGKFEIQESEVNLITLLEELEVVFGAQAKENNLQFETIIGEIDSVIILSDEVRIRQILYNLISNALKFTAKGFVRITLEQDQSLQIPKGSEQLKFIVEDTGIGIRRELQDSVFESFVQQEGQDYKTFGGTGLGLTISKKLAHLLGGDILLQSEEGKGSKFTFVLDHVKYLGTGESYIEYHKNQDVKFEAQKVLVIDDIESNRLYMQNALHDLGLIVVCVNNGLQGLIALDEHHIDLIITDIKMPELDGYGFITKLREGKHSDIPCVAYTASALENEINTIKKYDFNAVLLKPVQLENLINLLMQYIPYQLIEKKEEIKKDKLVSTLTEEEKNRIRVDLESFIEPLYYKLKDQQSFEDLNELCGILNRIGIEHNVPLFCYYSEQLTVAIDSFDIETIIGLVKSFGKIINPNK